MKRQIKVSRDVYLLPEGLFTLWGSEREGGCIVHIQENTDSLVLWMDHKLLLNVHFVPLTMSSVRISIRLQLADFFASESLTVMLKSLVTWAPITTNNFIASFILL